MPLYDYECTGCGKRFTAALTLRERERVQVECPGCGSKKVNQCITTFTAKTTKKS